MSLTEAKGNGPALCPDLRDIWHCGHGRPRPILPRMTKEVVVVGHGGAIGLELMSACEVLELANLWLASQGRPPGYRVQVMSLDGGPLPLFGGVHVDATRSLRRFRGPIDT